KVFSRPDVAGLEAGKKHLLYFQGVQMPWRPVRYVSVIVAKDGRLGKRFILTRGVHGDEMSSIRTVRTVSDPLDPAQISGTATAMLSRPAVESVQRRWPNSGRGAGLIDM